MHPNFHFNCKIYFVIQRVGFRTLGGGTITSEFTDENLGSVKSGFAYNNAICLPSRILVEKRILTVDS